MQNNFRYAELSLQTYFYRFMKEYLYAYVHVILYEKKM